LKVGRCRDYVDREHNRIIFILVYHSCTFLLIRLRHYNSGVEAKDAEVKSGTETEVSCVISGLEAQIKEVTWQHNGNTLPKDGYTASLTPLVKGSQTAKLAVKGSKVTEDKDYTCRISSGEYEQSPTQDTVVKLNVYGKRELYLHFPQPF
jgi:hypothetical protein